MADWISEAYGTYVVTYLTGLTFYLRFDAKRRPLRRRLLGMHLIMAIMTFISLTSAMAIYAFPSPPVVHQTSKHSTMWYYVLQHRAELKRNQSKNQLTQVLPGAKPGSQ